MRLSEVLYSHPNFNWGPVWYDYPGRCHAAFAREFGNKISPCGGMVFQGLKFFDVAARYYKENNKKDYKRLKPLRKYFEIFARIEEWFKSGQTIEELGEDANYLSPQLCRIIPGASRLGHDKCYYCDEWSLFQYLLNYDEIPANDFVDLIELQLISNNVTRYYVCDNYAKQIKQYLDSRG